jgi:hypothetical protein
MITSGSFVQRISRWSFDQVRAMTWRLLNPPTAAIRG